MNKQYFTCLAGYNSLANDKAMSWLSQVGESQWEKTVVSSFGSIEDTVIHIASAEKIWIDFCTKAIAPGLLIFLFRRF